MAYRQGKFVPYGSVVVGEEEIEQAACDARRRNRKDMLFVSQFDCILLRIAAIYVEKLEPQPQDLVEWGLMKLKPWRMRVSS